MSEKETLRYAGDYTINKLEISSSINKVDVRNQTVSVEFFEDVENPYISGFISLYDPHDYISNLPLIGDEILELEIETPEIEVIKGTFFIHSITDVLKTGVSTRVYKIHFSSLEFVKNENTSISAAYNDTGERIIDKILKNKESGLDSKKDFYFEPSANKLKFVSPFWRPFDCIDYVCSRTASKKGGSSYLFFETKKGYYYFTLEELYSQETAFEFKMDMYEREEDGSMNILQDFKRIEFASTELAHDQITNYRSGALANRKLMFDPLKKVYYDINQDFMSEKVWKARPHLNPERVYPKEIGRSPDSFIMRETRVTNSHMDSNLSRTDRQLRQAVMALYENTKLMIRVRGRCDYTAGMVVDVKYPKHAPLRKEDVEPMDEYFSGRYLVKSLNHTFVTGEGHICTMNLVKESNISKVD
jgi:hypothetical protein